MKKDKSEITIFYPEPERQIGQSRSSYFETLRKQYEFLLKKQEQTMKESDELVSGVYKSR
jgi:hypothetical protein